MIWLHVLFNICQKAREGGKSIFHIIWIGDKSTNVCISYKRKAIILGGQEPQPCTSLPQQLQRSSLLNHCRAGQGSSLDGEPASKLQPLPRAAPPASMPFLWPPTPPCSTPSHLPPAQKWAHTSQTWPAWDWLTCKLHWCLWVYTSVWVSPAPLQLEQMSFTAHLRQPWDNARHLQCKGQCKAPMQSGHFGLHPGSHKVTNYLEKLHWLIRNALLQPCCYFSYHHCLEEALKFCIFVGSQIATCILVIPAASTPNPHFRELCRLSGRMLSMSRPKTDTSLSFWAQSYTPLRWCYTLSSAERGCKHDSKHIPSGSMVLDWRK